MRCHGIYAVFTAIFTATFTVATLFAQDQSVVAEPQTVPYTGPRAIPDSGPVQTVESMPGPNGTQAEVHPTPPISYHTGPRARRMLACNEQVNLTMVTKNPADCCLYEIPLCIPACCEGQPAVREGRGIFGRGVVEYCWPCGFTAKVKFRPVLCDVKVEYTCN